MPRVVLIIVVLNSLVLLGSTAFNIYLLNSIRAGTVSAAIEAEDPSAAAQRMSNQQYQFFPVEKIIVNLRGGQRERYFVLDLALQADLNVPGDKLQQLDPIVRNSVIASLSLMGFEALRSLPIGDLQRQLEEALAADFEARQLANPFDHVLVSKMIVQ